MTRDSRLLVGQRARGGPSPRLFALVIAAAAGGCTIHRDYVVDRAGWSVLSEPLQHVRGDDGGFDKGGVGLRRQGAVDLRITIRPDQASVLVEPTIGGLHLRPIEVEREDQSALPTGTAPQASADTPPSEAASLATRNAIDVAARSFFQKHALVPAREKGHEELVYLFPDALPERPPPGNNPWVECRTQKPGGTMTLGAISLIVGAVVAAGSLVYFAGRSNEWGGLYAAIGGIPAGGILMINGGVFMGIGAAMHPERADMDAYGRYLLLRF